MYLLGFNVKVFIKLTSFEHNLVCQRDAMRAEVIMFSLYLLLLVEITKHNNPVANSELLSESDFRHIHHRQHTMAV